MKFSNTQKTVGISKIQTVAPQGRPGKSEFSKNPKNLLVLKLNPRIFKKFLQKLGYQPNHTTLIIFIISQTIKQTR
jgi:hypothetical protein